MSSSKYFYNDSSNKNFTSSNKKYNHSILRKESNILFGIDLNESNKENNINNNNFVFNDDYENIISNNSNKNLKTPSKKIILFNKDNNTSGNYNLNSNNNTNNNIIITNNNIINTNSNNNNNNLFTLSNGNEQNIEKNNIKTELFNSSISKKFEFSEVQNKNIINIKNNTNEDLKSLNNSNSNSNNDNNNDNNIDNNSLEIISYTEANNKEEEDKKNTFNSFTLLNTNEINNNNTNNNNSYITYRTKIDTEYNIEDLNFNEKNKSKSCLIYNNNNNNKQKLNYNNTHNNNKYINNLMTIEEEKLKKIPHSKNSNFDNLISNKIKNNNNNKFNFHSKTKSILNHSDYSTSNNLWKFNNNNNINNNIENNNDELYNWLKKINLEEHYKTFIQKGIFSMNNVINDIKNKKFKINKNDIEEIGILNPGHIYRILIEIEIEIGMINNKIINVIFNENSMFNNDEFYVKNDFFEYVFGCCGVNKNNNNNNKFNIDIWLKKIGLVNLKENFIFNGFDKIEYLILQMFSSCPVNDEMLQKDLGIENEKDRDIIIMRLNKDVKYILRRVNNNNNKKNKFNEFTPISDNNNIINNNINNNINNIINNNISNNNINNINNFDNNIINNTSNIKSTTENDIILKNKSNNINNNNYCIIF